MRKSRIEKQLQIIDKNQEQENDDQFRCLRSSVTQDVYCTKEISLCIPVATSAFTKNISHLENNLSL